MFNNVEFEYYKRTISPDIPTCFSNRNRYSNINTCNNCPYLQMCINEASKKSQFIHGGGVKWL